MATPQAELLSPAADAGPGAGQDDSLALLLRCCHPALSAPSQIALTLRAVGGLTTAQIAAAFLVPEATMAQRISRAKRTIKDSGIPLTLPTGPEFAARRAAVLHTLYLIFNEGYLTSGGQQLTAPALSGEAIRLGRWLHRLLPDDAEVAGLLALMLLTDARRRPGPGRTAPGPAGRTGPRAMGPALIAEGSSLLAAALPHGEPGPFSCRRPSPRCTTRRPMWTAPTGRRSSACMSCSSSSRRTR